MVDIVTDGSFDEVPVGGLVPGARAEVSFFPQFANQQFFALIAPLLPTARTADNVAPVLADGEFQFLAGDGSQARALFGAGSIGERMAKACREANQAQPLLVIALADEETGVQATAQRTITGTATSAGQIRLTVGRQAVVVGVDIGDDATAVATAIVAAVNAGDEDEASIPVSAANTAGQVDFTCRHKGEMGNEILIDLGALPAGLAETPPVSLLMSGGAGNASHDGVIAALEGEQPNYWITPHTDDPNMDRWDTEMGARWGPLRQQYGLIFSARRGTLNELITWSSARNSPYQSTIDAGDVVTPAYERAALYGGILTAALANHPARALRTLRLVNDDAPPRDRERVYTDEQLLLSRGISTLLTLPDGGAAISRGVTHYQKAPSGDRDLSQLDVTTLATVQLIVQRFLFIVENEFINKRLILVNDDSPIASSVPHVTPKKAQARMVAEYRNLVQGGYAEDIPGFERRILVSRSDGDVTRLNFYLPPDIANPLYQAGIKVEAFLQYPADLVQ
ncbi:MAG: hypothetical protein AAF360_00115 [Pseudomonadota bacterium]